MNECKNTNISEIDERFDKAHELQDEIKKRLGAIWYEF